MSSLEQIIATIRNQQAQTSTDLLHGNFTPEEFLLREQEENRQALAEIKKLTIQERIDELERFVEDIVAGQNTESTINEVNIRLLALSKLIGDKDE